MSELKVKALARRKSPPWEKPASRELSRTSTQLVRDLPGVQQFAAARLEEENFVATHWREAELRGIQDEKRAGIQHPRKRHVRPARAAHSIAAQIERTGCQLRELQLKARAARAELIEDQPRHLIRRRWRGFSRDRWRRRPCLDRRRKSRLAQRRRFSRAPARCSGRGSPPVDHRTGARVGGLFWEYTCWPFSQTVHPSSTSSLSVSAVATASRESEGAAKGIVARSRE